jgi:hypothetical protein
MIVSLVLGNHWRGRAIWSEVEEPKALSSSLKIKEYSIANQSEPSANDDPLFVLEVGESLLPHSNEVKSTTSLQELIVSDDTDAKDTLPPMNAEEKQDNLNQFFEELFKSIDYSILIIFMGNINQQPFYNESFFFYLPCLQTNSAFIYIYHSFHYIF